MAEGLRSKDNVDQFSDFFAQIDKILQDHFEIMQEHIVSKKLQSFRQSQNYSRIDNTRGTNMQFDGDLSTAVNHSTSPSHSQHHSNNISAQETRPGLTLKSFKLDVPHFDGTDPLHWPFKINQFFEFHNTLEEQRITIASFHMDKPALSWF